MAKTPEKNTIGITGIKDVLPETTEEHVNPLNHDAHFHWINDRYQSEEDIKSGRGKEKLVFQEWTAKYRQ